MSATGSRREAPTPTAASSRSWVDYDADLNEWEQLLLCDAQTSGGLLAALPRARAEEVVSGAPGMRAGLGGCCRVHRRRRARPDPSQQGALIVPRDAHRANGWAGKTGS